MRQDERRPFVTALERARGAAYPAGEFVGQESFMRAGEILDLARRAGLAPGVSLLDLCCGIAGPGRLVATETGCDYLGIDYSPSAIDLARAAARRAGLECRFAVGRIPPLPPGRFDVVLLLETMLAFADKPSLVTAVAAALPAGGRFAATIEVGRPLSSVEQAAMPDADTVWPVPIDELVGLLGAAGLEPVWQQDQTATQLVMVEALLAAFEDDAAAIAPQIGQQALDQLLAAHRLWRDWLGSARIRKVALVARRVCG